MPHLAAFENEIPTSRPSSSLTFQILLTAAITIFAMLIALMVTI